MTSTSKLGLYEPIGTLRGPHELDVSTTTQFHMSNANAASVTIGDRVRIYNQILFDPHLSLLGTVVITNKEANVPQAGITRLTFAPALAVAANFADTMYDPEIINVTTAVSNQMQTIDDKLDSVLCTPGTRPGSPFVGQITCESAVFGAPPFEIRRWTGVIWELIVAAAVGGAGEVGGKVAYIVSNAASAVSTGTEVGPYISATFTARAGHTYLLEFSGVPESDFSGTITPEIVVKFRWSVGATVTTGGTLISTHNVDKDVNNTVQYSNTVTSFITLPSTQQVTIGIFHRRRSGQTVPAQEQVSFQANQHSYLAIEDAGII